jgi:ribosomal protein S18 acetylase RimI-like enzyme
MLIVDVQPSDERELEAMMIHVINTSVLADETEKSEVVQIVLKNLQLSMDNPQECVHLKCVRDATIVGVILVRNFWNLCSLFVDPTYQGEGIGRSLIVEAIERCASKKERSYVRVNSSANAVGFYKAIGFEVLEDQPRRGSSTPMEFVLPV